MNSEKKTEWMIAISDNSLNEITFKKLKATESEIKEYLMRCIDEDILERCEDCEDCTGSIEDIKQYIDKDTRQTIELYAYLCFSTYRINYSAQPLDLIPDITDSEKMVVKMEV